MALLTGAELAELVAGLPLVDHHCHSVTGRQLDRPAFERLLTEAGDPAAAGGSSFDTAAGAGVRRWCAPVLDLPAHAGAADYVARRAELGPAEVNRRLLGAAGVSDLLVDGGYRPGELLGAGELAAASGAQVHPVLRLEAVAEEVAAAGVSATGFAAAIAARIRAADPPAVALKSIAAYRTGLALEPSAPTPAEVTRAAGAWLAEPPTGPPPTGPPPTGRPRLADPVLVRMLLWTAVEVGLPLQVHTGFGDADLRLHRADPALLGDFCAAVAGTGTTVLLLHCYPYHRQAAYLAAIHPHVHLDLGLTLTHVGSRAPAVLAETLELAPPAKLLYSSDGFGLPELHLLGAIRFRRALTDVLTAQLASGDLTAADAARYARAIAAGTAAGIYRLR